MYGNGCDGIDRQRGQHREDALTEAPPEEVPVGVGELIPMHDADAFLLESRQQIAEHERVGAFLHPDDTFADLLELLLRVHAVRGHRRHAGLDLFLETRDPDLEELVEVLGVDRDELDPLEQRPSRIFSQREHPRVEL